jgi:hypothetical protein
VDMTKLAHEADRASIKAAEARRKLAEEQERAQAERSAREVAFDQQVLDAYSVGKEISKGGVKQLLVVPKDCLAQFLQSPAPPWRGGGA